MYLQERRILRSHCPTFLASTLAVGPTGACFPGQVSPLANHPAAPASCPVPFPSNSTRRRQCFAGGTAKRAKEAGREPSCCPTSAGVGYVRCGLPILRWMGEGLRMARIEGGRLTLHQ